MKTSSQGKAGTTFDVIIVGGGPAGLSAALVLGRSRRRVLVLDSGRPRNAKAHHIHNFLGREGSAPKQFLSLGRREVRRYGVEVLRVEVVSARRLSLKRGIRRDPAFEITLADGRTLSSRKLLLATGVADVLPAVEGAETYYGDGVHHCPYCDAWEYTDGHLVAYGQAHAAVGLALALRTWSARVTACTDGTEPSAKDKQSLKRNGIRLRMAVVLRLEGLAGKLRGVVFAKGAALKCDALFFTAEQTQHSDLPAMLGLEPVEEPSQVPTDGKHKTTIPGLYLAGDADGDVQFVIVAAAEGAKAAVALNRELQDEERCTKGD